MTSDPSSVIGLWKTVNDNKNKSHQNQITESQQPAKSARDQEKTHLNAETSVPPTAAHTNESTIAHSGPVWLCRTAVNASVVAWEGPNQFKASHRQGLQLRAIRAS